MTAGGEGRSGIRPASCFGGAASQPSAVEVGRGHEASYRAVVAWAGYCPKLSAFSADASADPPSWGAIWCGLVGFGRSVA